jgi:hypothetical protein
MTDLSDVELLVLRVAVDTTGSYAQPSTYEAGLPCTGLGVDPVESLGSMAGLLGLEISHGLFLVLIDTGIEASLTRGKVSCQRFDTDPRDPCLASGNVMGCLSGSCFQGCVEAFHGGTLAFLRDPLIHGPLGIFKGLEGGFPVPLVPVVLIISRLHIGCHTNG